MYMRAETKKSILNARQNEHNRQQKEKEKKQIEKKGTAHTHTHTSIHSRFEYTTANPNG